MNEKLVPTFKKGGINIFPYKNTVKGELGSALSEEWLKKNHVYEIKFKVIKTLKSHFCVGVTTPDNKYLGVDFC